MKKTHVSVIMPVYNAEKYLSEAIESILNQTFTDFEFLIFNDGSTDDSGKIIQKYADQDERIIFYNYAENTGYLKHLNTGLKEAKGKYIARMDADDISLPERFEKQHNFMETHEKVIVLGTAYKTIGTDETFSWNPNENNLDIKLQLFQECAFAHPTVMMRAEILKKNSLYYEQEYYPAEDYAFWNKLTKYGFFANLKDVLLYYRVHPTQISNTKASIQQNYANKAKNILYKNIEIHLEDEELNIMNFFFSQNAFPYTSTNLKKVSNILKNIYASPFLDSIYQDKEKYIFDKLNIRWKNLINNVDDYTLGTSKYSLSLFFQLFTFENIKILGFKRFFKIFFKCLIYWRTKTT